MRVRGPWRSLGGAGGPAGGRSRPQEPQTVGSEGVPGATCGPWDLRLAGSAARGLRPGPGSWVVASTGTCARGERGAVRAGRLVAGGLTESPTQRGRRACRGRTQLAGRAAAGARAGHRRAR